MSNQQIILERCHELLFFAVEGVGPLVDDKPLLSSNEFPKINIAQGPVVEPDQVNVSSQICQFEILVSVTSVGNNHQSSLTEYNKIRARISAILLSNHTLGLSGVMDVTETGTTAPETTRSSEFVYSTGVMVFLVEFRRGNS